jgi:outer membrane protein assembly factor BamB
VDVATDRHLTITLDSVPWRVAVNGNDVWATSVDAGAVYRVDASSGRTIARVDVGRRAKSIVLTKTLFWVSAQRDDGLVGRLGRSAGLHSAQGELVGLDTQTGRIRERIALGPSHPGAMAIVGNHAWVADKDGSRVLRVSLPD